MPGPAPTSPEPKATAVHSVAVAPRKLTPRGKERRRQLLDYSAHRFANHGYHPTSVADIVGGLGVGKGVFYWYFDSKEQLFHEILRTSQSDLRRAQRDAIAHEDDPLQRLELGVRAAFSWWASHPEIANLVAFAATDSTFHAAVRKGQETAIQDAVIHLRAAIERGEVCDADPIALAHAMLGVVTQLARELVFRRQQDPHDVADLAISLLFDGFRGAKAPAESANG